VAADSATPSLATNAVVTMLSRLLYLATRLAVPPLVLAHIGLEEYALWSAAFLLVMYVGLADAGFANVYVRFVARYHARGRLAAINRLLSTGMVALGGASLAIMLGLAWAIDPLIDGLGIAPAQRGTARVLLFGATGMFLLDLSLGAFCYLLHGLQRMREEQTIAVIGYLAEVVAIVALLNAGFGVYSLLLAFVLRYSWSLAAFVVLAHRLLPGLRVRPGLFDRRMLRHFLGYGSRVQLSALVSTVLVTLDRTLAGFFFGATTLALFELAGKLPLSAISVPAVISRVTLPAAAQAQAHDDRPRLQRLCADGTRYTALVAALPLAFLGSFAGPVAAAWLGGDAPLLADLPALLLLAALAAQLHVATGPGSAVFRATGQVSNEFVYHGLRIAAIAVALLVARLAFAWQPLALAAALAVGNSVASLAYLLFNQRRLGLRLAALLRRVAVPAAVPWTVAAALRPLWPDAARWSSLESVAALGVLGLVYLAVVAVVVVPLVLDRGERRWLQHALAQHLPVPALRYPA